MKPQEDGENYALKTFMICISRQVLVYQGDHLLGFSKKIDGNNQNQFVGRGGVLKVKAHLD